MQRVEYARVRRVLGHPIDAVWAPLSLFGGLERWVDGVQTCTLEGHGVGAIRTVGRNGRSVRERLEMFEPSAHRLAYVILDPHPLPATDVRSTIELRALRPRETEMIWFSEASSVAAEGDQLRTQIEGFFGRSIDGLDRLAAG